MTDGDTIDYYRDWTLRLLAGLFALAGFAPEATPVERVPGSVQRRIRVLLLRLESATRRLIYFTEKRLPETPAPAPKPGPTAAERSRLGYLSAQLKKKKRRRAVRRNGTRTAVFWLFDKPRYCPFKADPRRRPPRGGSGPRIWIFDGSDLPPSAAPKKAQTDRGDAQRLCRRMQALFGALDSLPDQALRLRRLMARRAEQTSKSGALQPIRSGAAPGYRYDGKGEEFDLLRGCHRMALEENPPPIV